MALHAEFWFGLCLFREPDAGNPPVRFDEREEETELSHRTEAAWRKPRQSPPGGYCHCASSRLYLLTRFLSVETQPAPENFVLICATDVPVRNFCTFCHLQ